MVGPCVLVECRRGSEVTACEHRGLGGHRSVRQCSGIPALSVVSVSTWGMTFLASCLLHHSDPILLQQPRFLPHVSLIVGLSNHYMCYRRRISHQPVWTLASHMAQPHLTVDVNLIIQLSSPTQRSIGGNPDHCIAVLTGSNRGHIHNCRIIDVIDLASMVGHPLDFSTAQFFELQVSTLITDGMKPPQC
jgi:hypothetical protein